ncbi:MAG: hypothetical protein KDC26_06055 [Armatimonadetes bacterium]|nr:hypothetical protein [Armatimonadota bacterium]
MPQIITIAGLSACGKTTLARDLSAAMNAPILTMDAYYRDISEFNLDAVQVASLNWDDLAMFHFGEFAEHVQELAHGKKIEAPSYDFSLSARRPITFPIQADPIAIIEGQFALAIPEVSRVSTINIFVEVPLEEGLERRIQRDVRERGRDQYGVETQWNHHVIPAYQKWIEPSRANADLVLSGKNNRQDNVQAVISHLAGLKSPSAYLES